MRHHRQGDMPIPAVPEAHLILIQLRLPFGLLHALLDGMARGSGPDERFEGGSRRRKGKIVRQLRRIGERPPGKQPDVRPGTLIPALNHSHMGSSET